jgi:hypothetical protein
MLDLYSLLHILVSPFTHLFVERYVSDSGYVRTKSIKQKVSALLSEDHEASAAQNIFSLMATSCVKNLATAFTNFLQSEIPNLSQKEQRGLVEFTAQALARFFEEGHLTAQILLDCNLQENVVWNRLNNSSGSESGGIRDTSRIAAFRREFSNLFARDFSDVEKSIFSFALRSSISVITETFLTVSPLEHESDVWKIRKLNQIGEQLDSLNERLQYVEVNSARSNDLANYQVERFYRREMSRATNSLQLLGIQVDQSFRSVPLDSAYVSLTLSSLAGQASSPRATLLDCLTVCARQHTDLVLVGDAGTGKTTLTRYLAYCLAGGKETLFDRRASATQQSGSLTDIFSLPFLISLREVRAFPLELDSLVAQFISIDADVMGWLTKRVTSERMIAIFDGLDEISEEKRHDTIKFIRSLKARFPRIVVVITTRPMTLKKLGLIDDSYAVAHINSLSIAEQLRLVDYWFSAMVKASRLNKNEHDSVMRLRQQLKSALGTSRALSNIAVNPLLCSCICALWNHNNGHVPSSYKEICDALVRMLLDSRDRERGLNADQISSEYGKLTSPQKRFIVKSIAYYMIRNDLSQVDQEWLLEVVGKVIGQFLEIEFDKALFGILVERCGLIREARPGSLEFIHNTFKEYLGAECASDEGDVGFLAGKASDAGWMQLIAFGAASENVKFADELLRQLYVKFDAEQESAKRIVATTFLKSAGAAIRIPSHLLDNVNSIKLSIIPPTNDFECESLASAGDEICDFLVQGDRDVVQALCCIRTLALNGSPKAVSVLMGYVHDGREAVRDELVKHVNPLVIPIYADRFVAGVALPASIRALITNLDPIMDRTEMVTRIDLSESYISHVDQVKLFYKLRELNLSRTPIVDINPLSDLGMLEQLDLSYTPIRNARPLARLKRLRVLYLDYSDCEELFELAEVPGLEILGLRRTVLSDGYYPHIGRKITIHVD